MKNVGVKGLTNLFKETYLRDIAFIIHKANCYNVKGRKYIGTPLKYYVKI